MAGECPLDCPWNGLNTSIFTMILRRYVWSPYVDRNYTAEGEPSQPSILLRHTWIPQDLRNTRCLLKTSILFSIGEGLVSSLLGLNVEVVFLKANFPSELFVVF